MNEEDDLENGKKGFAGCPEEVCVTMDAATQFCMKRCHVINPAVVDMKFEPSNLPQFEILPGGKLVGIFSFTVCFFRHLTPSRWMIFIVNGNGACSFALIGDSLDADRQWRKFGIVRLGPLRE